MEQIAIGADKAAVIAALGEPDNSPMGHLFAMCFARNAKECWTWELFGENYIEVWFDTLVMWSAESRLPCGREVGS